MIRICRFSQNCSYMSSERYMNHGSVSREHPTTMPCLSFILSFFSLSLYPPSWLATGTIAQPVIWCSCVVQTAAPASRLLLCCWLLLYAGWGAELNAARHIQLQSPQPINPKSPAHFLILWLGSVLHRWLILWGNVASTYGGSKKNKIKKNNILILS